jgi:streptogramin lyase
VVGGGRVWALDLAAGVLHGLDPATGATRNQLAVGAVPHFATAALSGTSVLIGTMSGLAIVGVG